MRHFAALLAAVLAGPSVAAAQVPDLSGTWVLQAAKSDFGPMPAPTSRTDVFEHKEPSLKVKRTIENAQGATSADLVYAIDGKPWKNSTPNGEISSTLKWDGAVLVVESTVNTPQGEAVLVDRFSLSSDGKTLTQERRISIGGQELAQTMVFEKR